MTAASSESMVEIGQLLEAVEVARRRFLAVVEAAPAGVAAERPAEGAWSLVDLTEHMVRAEAVGVRGIWSALEAHRRGERLWKGDAKWRGLPIEAVIEKTWRDAEEAPDVAAPRTGGSLEYWCAALRASAPILAELGRKLEGQELEAIVYPHPLSGPLDARQRLEFLRFHLDRHRQQAARIVDRLTAADRG